MLFEIPDEIIKSFDEVEAVFVKSLGNSTEKADKASSTMASIALTQMRRASNRLKELEAQ